MTTNATGRTEGCTLTGCGWPQCDCPPRRDKRNLYQEMQSICTMLRRLHLQDAKDTSELAIDVDDDVFKGILATVPAEHQMSRFTDTRISRNEILICGVIVRGRAPGLRDEEERMLKHGYAKVWARGPVR